MKGCGATFRVLGGATVTNKNKLVNVTLLGNKRGSFSGQISKTGITPFLKDNTSIHFESSVMWLESEIFHFQEANVSYFPNGLGEGEGHNTDVVKACLMGLMPGIG